MEIALSISGLDEAIRVMERLPGLLSERIQGDGLIAAARVVRDQAKARVPVRTGALRRSIRALRRSGNVETSGGVQRVPGQSARVRAGGPGARHAFLVEGGTVHSRAQPYLAPALTSTQSQQISAAADAMRAAFVRLGRQLQTGTTPRYAQRLVSVDT